MVENVVSQLYVLIKKDIAFCTSGFKVAKSASETELQKWPTPALAPEFNLENSLFAAQLFHFPEQHDYQGRVYDGWRKRGDIHMEGVFNKIKNLRNVYLHH